MPIPAVVVVAAANRGVVIAETLYQVVFGPLVPMVAVGPEGEPEVARCDITHPGFPENVLPESRAATRQVPLGLECPAPRVEQIGVKRGGTVQRHEIGAQCIREERANR